MANDIAISVGLQNQQYTQAMHQSRQAAENYNKTLQKSQTSFRQYEKSMNRSSGSMRINTNVMQNAIYMVEDMSSVYGTSGLAGAIRAGSNNLTMMASALGPWGMAAAVAISSATQLYLAFNKNADSAAAASEALKKYGEQLEEIMNIEAQRVQFQHSLRDADTAASASRLLKSEKDTLDTIQAQIAKAKELEEQRKQELETLQKRKQVLEARTQQDLGPMGPGIGQIDDGSREDTAKQVAELEKKIAENKAQQTGNQNRLNDLVVQQAAQEERIAKARKNAMEMAKSENARLQENKRAMLSAKKAQQDRERAAKRELENEKAIAAATAVAANNKRVIQNQQVNVNARRSVAQSTVRGSRDFALAFARTAQSNTAGLSKRDLASQQAMERKRAQFMQNDRGLFGDRRKKEAWNIAEQQRWKVDNNFRQMSCRPQKRKD